MKILLTGAGGFIGSKLYDRLSKKHKVISIFSSSNSVSDYNCYSLDLTKKKRIEKIGNVLSIKKIDAIIHLASKVASSDKIEDLTLLKENIAISENLVFLAKKIKPKVLINFSSMAVYPNISGLFSEKSLPAPQKNPDCIYGLSKYCSEVVIGYLLKNENIRILHLRISQVHGNGMRSDRIIPVMLKELKENNRITVYGNGERTSNFINVDKLAKEIEFFLQEDKSGVYNIGDQNISYSELAQQLIDQYGDKISIINKEPKGNKEKFMLDISKLRSIHKPKRK